jgi:hypothetical protein
MHNLICHALLHFPELLQTSLVKLLTRSLSCKFLQIADRQPTNEISINQLIQIYRMAGTVSHSIGCRDAIEILTETLQKQAVQYRAWLNTTEIQHCQR